MERFWPQTRSLLQGNILQCSNTNPDSLGPAICSPTIKLLHLKWHFQGTHNNYCSSYWWWLLWRQEPRDDNYRPRNRRWQRQHNGVDQRQGNNWRGNIPHKRRQRNGPKIGRPECREAEENPRDPKKVISLGQQPNPELASVRRRGFRLRRGLQRDGIPSKISTCATRRLVLLVQFVFQHPFQDIPFEVGQHHPPEDVSRGDDFRRRRGRWAGIHEKSNHQENWYEV